MCIPYVCVYTVYTGVYIDLLHDVRDVECKYGFLERKYRKICVRCQTNNLYIYIYDWCFEGYASYI